MLTKDKGLPTELYEEVWMNKQKLTIDKLKNLPQSEQLIECMSSLTNDGYKIAVCSNSIRKTVLTVLSKLGIIEYVDLIISNEDVKNSKPHPEMYWKAISMMSFLPEQTLIVEDSPYGLLAASRSKSHVLRVKSPTEVSYSNIIKKINEIKMGNMLTTPKWKNEKLNILIPMAGAGSRFEQAGYTFPKPLIEVNGKPMIHLYFKECGYDVNYFWHEEDTLTLTSHNHLWVYPGKQPIEKSIAVMPEIHNDDVSKCLGICSDYIEKYKN